jgi:hypothetical protein
MKLTYGDGGSEDVPKHVCQAFAALARGDASGGQQKLCLMWVFKLTQPMGRPPLPNASERAVGMSDGARIVGQQVAELVGGEAPWTLKHLGDVNDDGNDRET